jgi:hypothetical protein
MAFQPLPLRQVIIVVEDDETVDAEELRTAFLVPNITQAICVEGDATQSDITDRAL